MEKDVSLLKAYKVLELGRRCPNCGSKQFSISFSPPERRPPHWGPDILGTGDCGGCQQEFLVALAPELKEPILALLRFHGILYLEREEVVKALNALFPQN